MRATRLILLLPVLMVLSARAAGPFVNKEKIAGAGSYLIGNSSGTLGTVQTTIKEDQRLVGSLLAVFLGPFGAHRLYLGTTPRVAILYGITFGGFGILPLLDLGHLLFAKDLMPYRMNGRVFMWSQPSATPP